MSHLPDLSALQADTSSPESPLAQALTILFEHSPILTAKLEPQLAPILASRETPLASYTDLIDNALALIGDWDIPSRAEFISGHPRIGETKNLSTLSAKEQSSASTVAPTPPEVLARLAHLNACYEIKYPGLRYITFVNGRSRQAIVEEMEEFMQIQHSLSATEPPLSEIAIIGTVDERWRAELGRAIYDVGRIAKSRLKALGVE